MSASMIEATTVANAHNRKIPAATAAASAGRGTGFAPTALRVSVAAWLVAALMGQLVFATYVVGFFGRTAVQGNVAAWSRELPSGLVPGATVFNLALILHLVFAVLIMAGGALQLVPRIRRRWPAMHRWNGRVYMLTSTIMSVGGTYMIWTRGAVGDLSQNVAITLNALLIVTFAGLAWTHARAGRMQAHRRWALRLFLVVSGVWFFRIGLMLWLVLNQGPVGFDPKTFTGPFLTFLSFAQYLLPLLVLELYLRAHANPRPGAQWAVTAVLAVATVLTLAGGGAATALMWLPKL